MTAFGQQKALNEAGEPATTTFQQHLTLRPLWSCLAGVSNCMFHCLEASFMAGAWLTLLHVVPARPGSRANVNMCVNVCVLFSTLVL